ncbi:MAG: efflux RND transporter periplasmic adaptor subunit [Anaerolineales bacterium]|jgi:HlyD family secretion protein
MKRWILVAALIVVVVGGAIGLRIYRIRQAENQLSELQTVGIETGQLTATVGATGTVRADQSTVLAFETTGIVGTVFVDTGDSVAEGEILAELQPSSLSPQVILAQADLVNAQKALTDLLVSDIQRTQAYLTLIQSQEALHTAVYNWETFRLGYPNATWYEQNSVDRQLSIAEDRLEDAQEALDALSEGDEGRAEALQAVADAQAAVDLANWLVAWYEGDEPGEIDRSLLDANVAIAQAGLTDAQRSWERVANGPHPDDIAAAQARINAAQATIDLATIAAPFSGTITSSFVQHGDLVTPGTLAFGLSDLSPLFVDVQISEIDINRLQTGQEVVLTFDAIPNQTYLGTINQIDMVGTAIQGVVNFKVIVELDGVDEAVKPGMTAAVNIIVSQIDGVLLIPNRAVRVRDGQRVVYLLKDDQIEPVAITLGASSETYSELVEGDIEIGDLVILNPPAELEHPSEFFSRP